MPKALSHTTCVVKNVLTTSPFRVPGEDPYSNFGSRAIGKDPHSFLWYITDTAHFATLRCRVLDFKACLIYLDNFNYCSLSRTSIIRIRELIKWWPWSEANSDIHYEYTTQILDIRDARFVVDLRFSWQLTYWVCLCYDVKWQNNIPENNYLSRNLRKMFHQDGNPFCIGTLSRCISITWSYGVIWSQQMGISHQWLPLVLLSYHDFVVRRND